jgi:hypothetical protein
VASQILDAILPDIPMGRTARRIAAAAILLLPAVFVAGLFLLMRTEPRPPVPVKIDPPSAIEIARAFAVSHGIAAQSWKASYGWDDEKNLLKFLNENPADRVVWKFAPPLAINVSLREPTGEKKVTVSLSLEGRVIGFDGEDDFPSTAALSEAEALRLAESQLPPEVPFGRPVTQLHGADYTFIFRSSQIPGVEVKEEIREHGRTVDFVKASAEADHGDSFEDKDTLQDVLIMLGSLFAFLVIGFSVYRYAMRAMQGEVSHKRSIIVALLCGSFCCLLASNATTVGDAGSVPKGLILLAFGMAGLAGGLFLAAAYGSGEGDIREAYPGKLTSLDALLTGRIFSRNVGVSVVFGSACAGWVTFALAVVLAGVRSPAPRGSENMLSPFTHNGWLIGLVVYPLGALSLAAGGLLQPLAFLQRYMKRATRWHLPILVLCSVLVGVLHSNSPTNAEFLLRSVAMVVALLVPFFLRDLLAALVCVTSTLFVSNLASILVVLPDSTFLPAAYVAGATLLFLGALFCVRYGKAFTEEQVRPLYARHIAQRKSLEAEVSAAREAQLRLMPQSVPEFEGLSIAASCIPAETVGGDFYDFFTLSDGRLGIFIAEGNNGGLAAALTIALAKGYLMHCVGQVREPVDILVRLETALYSILGSSSGLAEFAFATVDTVHGEIRYARTGTYPKVLIPRTRSATIERLVPVQGRQDPITAGSASLEPGDYILLFTDGVGRPLESSGNLKFDRSTGAEEARKRVMALAKRGGEPDDLTVIVVQVHSVGVAALEVVA